MPPRRAAASKKAAVALPKPLDDCVVACSGTFPTLNSHGDLLDKVEAAGGIGAKSVTKKTSHLISTQADYDKPSAKVKKAQELGIHIISLDWLEDCIASSAHEPESKYTLGAASGTTTNTTNTANTATPAATPAGSAGAAAAPHAKQAGPATAPAAPNGSKKRQAPASPSPNLAKGDDDSDAEEAKPKKKKKIAETKEEEVRRFGEGQIAKSRDINVPLDDHCYHKNYSVFIDPDDGIIWDASLNQTNSTANNNKFYRIQLLVDAAGSDYKTWTRWGRVGDWGTNATLGNGSLDDAKRNFEKKFKDKSGLKWENRTDPPVKGKYTFVERSYADDSDDEDAGEEPSTGGDKAHQKEPPKSELLQPVQNLMQLIFNQQYLANNMSALKYDTQKLPLGKLSRATILKGFQTLKDLSALIDDSSLAAQYGVPHIRAVENLSNAYYSLIPHDFGRQRPPVVDDQNMVKTEIELLENLADMKDAADIMKAQAAKNGDTVHFLDKQYNSLGIEEMTPLDPGSIEFKNLAEYLMETRGHTHGANYSIQDIFRVERRGERDRFDKSIFSGPPKDRRLLWHGSRATNFGGILSQGLRIAPPEAPASGYMFDKGIYLADMSSKSANYCCPYITGGDALLLLCEAELGTPMQELTNARSNAGSTAKAKKMWSTWGQGRTAPKEWKDASCVHPSLKGVTMPDTSTKPPGDTNIRNAALEYNEYICYDVSQVRLRYLFRVHMY